MLPASRCTCFPVQVRNEPRLLHFLTSADNAFPLHDYFRDWGGSLRGRSQIISYERIADPLRLRAGAYVFCDVERLPPAALAWAREVFGQLSSRPDRFRLINDPRRMLGRKELLRTLHARGLNDFNVYGPEDSRAEMRYPAFVRHARQHSGADSALLSSGEEVAASIAAVSAQGRDPADVLVVEFMDTREGGEYRKYSVMRIGPALLAMHIFFDDTWMVKGTTVWPPERVAADNAFMLENPHAEAVAAVFDIAGIEFGRIDYAVRDGKVQTWEINTVPTILLAPSYYSAARLPAKRAFAQRFNEALAALDHEPQRLRILERMLNYRRFHHRSHR